MLAVYKRKTNILVGLGLAMQIAGRIMMGPESPLPIFSIGFMFTPTPGGLLEVVGMAVLTWGCCAYAQGKGYHPALGLIGIVPLIGLVIMVLLPDRHRVKRHASANKSAG